MYIKKVDTNYYVIIHNEEIVASYDTWAKAKGYLDNPRTNSSKFR